MDTARTCGSETIQCGDADERLRFDTFLMKPNGDGNAQMRDHSTAARFPLAPVFGRRSP